MNNIVLSTRNIDDFISDIANEVVKKIELWNINPLVPANQADQWFDLKQLCNYLPEKPSTATVYGWVHTSNIPCHKGGKKLRFLKSEIDNWLMRGKKKASDEIGSEADAYLLKRKGGAK